MTTGRTRGIEFERDVCRKLSLWWTGGKDDSTFWRTQTSGGRARTRAKKGLKLHGQHGDVCAVTAEGRPFTYLFVVELKKGYQKLSLHDLLDRPKKGRPSKESYKGFIEKTVEACRQAGTWSWILIVQRRQRETLVVMPYGDFKQVGGSGAHVVRMKSIPPCATFWIESNKQLDHIVVVRLADWFQWVFPETIRSMSEQWSPYRGRD